MATWYEECPTAVLKMAQELIARNHPHLVEADVKVTFLFAHNDEGVPIMHNGWPAFALARIHSLRDRVGGLADCSVTIDARAWHNKTKAEQEARLDHELHHFLIKRNKAGAVVYDDATRPKLKMRPHDFQFGGFHEIVRRHGEQSAEVEAITKVRKAWEQMEFAFMKEAESA